MKTPSKDNPLRRGQEPLTNKEFYEQYLLSPEWKAKRVKVFRRAKNKCEICKKRSAKEVHHKTYARLGAEWLSDLRAVCKECHIEIHSKPRNSKRRRKKNKVPKPEQKVWWHDSRAKHAKDQLNKPDYRETLLASLAHKTTEKTK